MNQLLKSLAIYLLIFIISFSVRIIGLGTFLTTDESIWLEHSRHFISALVIPDYECPPVNKGRQVVGTDLYCTFQEAHPGVITMWSGSIGILSYYKLVIEPSGESLEAFLTRLKERPFEAPLLPYLRFPIVVITSFSILGFHFFIKRLVSYPIAILATAFVTFNIFYIANSRFLHHDALTATFMTLALLSMIFYWFRGQSRFWIFMAGILTGLGFLCKPVSWFMAPFALVLGCLSLYYSWQVDNSTSLLKQICKVGLNWLILASGAILSFVVFFPAMWVKPIPVLQDLILQNIGLKDAGHKHFFLGQISNDPGPLFYPIGWLLRASPLEMLALGLFLYLGIRLLFGTGLIYYLKKYPVYLSLLCFLVSFLAFVIWSDKKMMRYFLAFFIIIDIFAAVGLWWFLDKLSRKYIPAFKHYTLTLGLGLIVISHSMFIAIHAPYYLTFYNPLLGGNVMAAKIMTIFGWGEALSEVAHFLNTLPNPETISVASQYDHAIDTFFPGKVRTFSENRTGSVLERDYLVYHINQLQREMYDPALWFYLSEHYQPVYTTTMYGLNYNYVYQNPVKYTVDWEISTLPNQGTIYGYNLTKKDTFIVFWETINSAQSQNLWLVLESLLHKQTNWISCPSRPEFEADNYNPNVIIESECQLPLAQADDVFNLYLHFDHETTPAEMPFPDGKMRLGLVNSQYNLLDEATAYAHLAQLSLPDEATRTDLLFGDIAHLAGYSIEPVTSASSADVRINLYWQATAKLTLEYAQAFQIAFKVYNQPSDTSSRVDIQPFLASEIKEIKPGFVSVSSYRIANSQIPPKIELCLQVAANAQTVFAQAPDGTSYECIPLQ